MQPFWRRCDDATGGRLLPAKHPVNRAGERRDSQGKVIQVVLSEECPDRRTWRPSGRSVIWMAVSTDPAALQGERVCLEGLAELEIRLMTVGLLQRVQLHLEPDQDLNLQLIPSPTPRDGLLVKATAR